MPLFPSNDLFPSDSLYPGIELVFDDTKPFIPRGKIILLIENKTNSIKENVILKEASTSGVKLGATESKASMASLGLSTKGKISTKFR